MTTDEIDLTGLSGLRWANLDPNDDLNCENVSFPDNGATVWCDFAPQ